jgi:hypothetical protein
MADNPNKSNANPWREVARAQKIIIDRVIGYRKPDNIQLYCRLCDAPFDNEKKIFPHDSTCHLAFADKLLAEANKT